MALKRYRFAQMLFRSTPLAACVVAAGCVGTPDSSLEISGPTTANSTIVDLPPGPVSQSATTVERRLRAAGVSVTAIDRQNGFITARTQNNAFVDCGQIRAVVDGRIVEADGNAPRLVLPDPDRPGETLVRTLASVTSAGIGITQGVTNTVVVALEHRVTITLRSAETGRQIGSQTLAFTDKGFAAFDDGTICRSSDQMNRAVR